MQKLDDIVIDAVSEKIFTTGRLQKLLEALIDQSTEGKAFRRAHISKLRNQMAGIEDGIRNLHRGIEKGLLDIDDPKLKYRLDQLNQQTCEISDEIKNPVSTNQLIYKDYFC